jgi:transcriptional regulator with XRE-family HTH domain
MKQESLAQRYMWARQQAGLSIGQAARVMQMEHNRVSALEKAIDFATMTEVEAMRDAYGVTLEYLKGEDNHYYIVPEMVQILSRMSLEEQRSMVRMIQSLGIFRVDVAEFNHGPYCEACGECVQCYHEECAETEDGEHVIDWSAVAERTKALLNGE